MQYSFRTTLLLPALFVIGCAPAGPAPLTDADRTAIQAVSDTFAKRLVARDLEGLGQLYTEDGTVMAPNAPPVRGRAAIKEFIAAFPPVGAFTAVNDTIVGFGDRAYVRGHFTLGFADTTMGTTTGKFIEIRHKQADGQWLYEVDMWSENAPPPAPAPAPATKRR